MSTKLANGIAVGGGVIIFLITAAITVYMTSEHNKEVNYKKLQLLYQELSGNRLFLLGDGNDNCKLCQFPFKYQGETYTQCVRNDSYSWCPNLVDENGDFTKGSFNRSL